MALPNALYRENEPGWLFNLVCYLGDSFIRKIASAPDSQVYRRVWSTSSLAIPQVNLLWQHGRESQTDYLHRIATSTYRRIAGQTLDQLVACVMQGVPAPVAPAKMPEEWLDNVDGGGVDWRRFTADVAGCKLLFGVAHVLGDLPAAGDESREQGVPYLCLLTPLSLLDWDVDRMGRYHMARIQEQDEMVEGRAVKVERVWTAESVQTWREDKIVEEVPNRFGRVPLESIFYDRDPTLPGPIGRPWMDTPARLNQGLYNVDSWVMSILRTVTFPVLAMPTPSGVTSIDSEIEQDLSTTRAIPIPEGGQVPSWLVPDRQAVDVLKEHADSLALEIRKLGGFHQDGGDQTQGVQSAEALRLKRTNLDALLDRMGRNLEEGMTRVGRMVCEIAGWEPQDDFVQEFPSDYGEKDTGVRLEELTLAKDLGLPPKAMAVLKKSAVRTTFPQLDAETVAEIEKEIDADVIEEAERAKAAEDKALEIKQMMAGQKPPMPGQPPNGKGMPMPMEEEKEAKS